MNTEQLSKRCRTCLAVAENTLSIFEASLHDILTEYASIKVFFHDLKNTSISIQ